MHPKICTTVTENSVAHLTLYDRPKKKNRHKMIIPACRHGGSSQLGGGAGQLGGSAAAVAAVAQREARRQHGGGGRPTDQPTDRQTD